MANIVRNGTAAVLPSIHTIKFNTKKTLNNMPG
jgi:hypothetical protein